MIQEVNARTEVSGESQNSPDEEREGRFARAILLITIENLRDIYHRCLSAVAQATERTTERLVIIICSELFNDESSRTKCWDEVQSMLASVYVESTYVAHKLDRPLMDVDVLMVDPRIKMALDRVDFEGVGNWHALFFIEGDPNRYPCTSSLSVIPWVYLKVPSSSTTESPDSSKDLTATKLSQPSYPSTFPVVALGGTFDHLHSGHKILLSMSAWIAHKKVIVGVTDDKLLQKKKHKEVLESLDVRMERVRKFLEFFKPGLIYDIVPINDVCGPTATDPDIQALVVSKETLAGAAAIAKAREEKNFPPLECFVIDVISATSAKLDAKDMDMLRESKMSSTYIREYIVSRRSKE